MTPALRARPAECTVSAALTLLTGFGIRFAKSGITKTGTKFEAVLPGEETLIGREVPIRRHFIDGAA
jgi:hypothetical protein